MSSVTRSDGLSVPLPLAASHCSTWPTPPSSPRTLPPRGSSDRHPPLLRLFVSCSSFVFLSSFPGAQAPHFLCSTSLFLTFFLALSAVPSLTAFFKSSPVSRHKFAHQLRPLESPFPSSCWKRVRGPLHPRPVQLGALQRGLYVCPPSLTLFLCSLVWLMRRKVSVPFIRDSQSWEILAGNFGQAPHLFARKYPPWASLKS